MSEEKFSKCEERGKKKISVEFPGVRKKRRIEKESIGEKIS